MRARQGANDMPFSITAELSLGTFRGHGADGRPEPIPSVARLHSALLCAAGFGPRARVLDDGLTPCHDDVQALRWIEDNPPDGVSIPPLSVNRGPAIAYREDGTLKKSKGALSMKRLAKSPTTSVAVNGSFRWTWTEPPPPAVMDALVQLCGDVPCLGTSESPVRLTTTMDDVETSHVLEEAAHLFATGGLDVMVPRPGRVDELTAFRAGHDRTPTVAKDHYGTDETSSSPVPPRGALAVARYSPVDGARADVPWPHVLIMPLDRAVPERLRVRWAVAAHRALIAAVGDGAPPLLTGAYAAGQARPCNRVALQLLEPQQPFDLPTGAPAALAVLIPLGAQSGDVQAVLRAVGNIKSLRGPSGELRRVTGAADSVDGSQFWREPAPGFVRLWRTDPPAVPDTRGTRSDWTFGDAALLSLGFVWHGSSALPRQSGRGDALQRAMVGAVRGAGAVVVAADPVRSSAVHDYVHRVNEHAVVRPYRATVSVGDLGGERVIQAIGQSRHLGGGLLVPFDIPVGPRATMAQGSAVAAEVEGS